MKNEALHTTLGPINRLTTKPKSAYVCTYVADTSYIPGGALYELQRKIREDGIHGREKTK